MSSIEISCRCTRISEARREIAAVRRILAREMCAGPLVITMSLKSVDSQASGIGQQQPRGPSDVASVPQEMAGMLPLEENDPLKKLRRQLWTRVLCVDSTSIEQVRAESEHDDVSNALTNVDVMAPEENGEAEIFFNASIFEKPPANATLSDFRLPEERLEGLV